MFKSGEDRANGYHKVLKTATVRKGHYILFRQDMLHYGAASFGLKDRLFYAVRRCSDEGAGSKTRRRVKRKETARSRKEPQTFFYLG